MRLLIDNWRVFLLLFVVVSIFMTAYVFGRLGIGGRRISVSYILMHSISAVLCCDKSKD